MFSSSNHLVSNRNNKQRLSITARDVTNTQTVKAWQYDVYDTHTHTLCMRWLPTWLSAPSFGCTTENKHWVLVMDMNTGKILYKKIHSLLLFKRIKSSEIWWKQKTYNLDLAHDITAMCKMEWRFNGQQNSIAT